MLIATAPATVTVLLSPLEVPLLSEVWAFAPLVSLVFDVLPVLALLSLFAFETWSSALPFTSLPELSFFVPLSWPWAPAALASASVSVSDEPFAEKLTFVALIVRESVAVTSSSGIASASARPMATSPPVASPFAVVVAVAVCVALTLTAPEVVSVCEASPAMVALV
ncbi:MAG: hypothetical protein ACXVDD_03565, partial [Polyangia bacterium]